MSLVERPRRHKAEINIVPLVDVLIVLIFFFIVSMQFRNLTMLNLVLPKIETAGTNKFVEQMEIAVDQDGQIFFNGSKLTEKQLQAAIRIQADVDKDVPVLIMADEVTQLKKVTFIMDACRKAGMETIRLQSR
jgi:biopolymer transport protein ExbD